MAKAFGFKGKRGVSIQDPLFLYIEFEEEFDPRYNTQIKEIIQDVDAALAEEGVKGLLESLPFATFNQAERLFRELQVNFGTFHMRGIALCDQVDNKRRRTGKATMADQPKITPFVITPSYENIFQSLVEATRRDERFAQYSHDELTLYFTSAEINLLEVYRTSLGLSRGEAPLYPLPGTIPGELMRGEVQAQSPSGEEDEVGLSSPVMGQPKASPTAGRDKLSLAVAGAGIVLGLSGLLFAANVNNRLNQQNQVITDLSNRVERSQILQAEENRIDVVSRYFLSYYYSGKKENIAPFLSDGDAKYTTPEMATLSSVLLENIALTDEGTYQVAYILGLKSSEGTYRIERITFDLKKDEQSQYGFVIDTEPLLSKYEPIAK